jgi:hypothetical protein
MVTAMKYLIAILALTGASLVPATEGAGDCLAAATTVQQQQDCCKKNKGVCGCRAGKIVCCDKTFADNCSC